MGGIQVWVKMCRGEGQPITTMQLGLRRIPGLDRLNFFNRKLEASLVLWRKSTKDKWKAWGHFHITPLLDIPIGSKPPDGSWTLWNDMYYHSDRIPQDICDAYKESVRQDKEALEEEEKQNAKKALEERVRQMIIEEEQDEFFQQLHAREEDTEQDAVLQGTRRFKRLRLGEDTMHTYIPIPIQSIPRGGYFTLDVAGPLAGNYGVARPWENIACKLCRRITGQKQFQAQPGNRDAPVWQMRCFDFISGKWFTSGQGNRRRSTSSMLDPAAEILEWVHEHRTCC